MVAGCQIGNVEFLPQFTTARILIVIGLARAVAGGFLKWDKNSRLDQFMLLFSVVAVVSSIGHTADFYFPSPFKARVGLVINVLGTYLFARAYLPDFESFRRYAFILPIIILPLAVGLSIENRTRKNVYRSLGGSTEAAVREERVRAQGPFRHPILAGTCGATALPFAYLLWRSRRRVAGVLGFTACFGVVLASSSSGPLAAVAVTMAAIFMWRWRYLVPHLVWTAVILGFVYNIAKGRGPWYIMASLDLVGGSTGWHRAKLIDQGFKYLGEWWLWGTDYTRHWMSSGVRWNPNMVDLTNYYLHLGVTGGLGLSLCLIAFIVVSFRMLLRRMREMRSDGDPREITLWCAAAALAAHAVSFISISYFDQMYVFFYSLLGAIPGLVAVGQKVVTEPEIVSDSIDDSERTQTPVWSH